MEFEAIQKLWDVDCNINRDNLIEESLKIPQLHSKYYNIYIQEKRKYKDMEERIKKFEHIKWMYYQGKLSKADLEKMGWEQCDLKFLKSDITKIVEADDEVSQYRIKLAEQYEKCEYLKAIIQTLNNRSFLIGHAIDLLKFEMGIGNG